MHASDGRRFRGRRLPLDSMSVMIVGSVGPHRNLLKNHERQAQEEVNRRRCKPTMVMNSLTSGRLKAAKEMNGEFINMRIKA